MKSQDFSGGVFCSKWETEPLILRFKDLAIDIMEVLATAIPYRGILVGVVVGRK